MWNPCMSNCECGQTSASAEYLHFNNCRSHIFEKLVLISEHKLVNASSITPGTMSTNFLDKKATDVKVQSSSHCFINNPVSKFANSQFY